MRHLDDSREQGRIERAVDLGLDVSQVGITIDSRVGLLLRGDENAGGGLHGIAAVDHSRLRNARADGGSVRPLLLHQREVLDVVAHVADGGDSAGDVHDSIRRVRMDVHVIEAGQERFAAAIDVLSVLRHGN